MCFVIFQPEDNFNDSQLRYAYKRYAYKNECILSKPAAVIYLL